MKKKYIWLPVVLAVYFLFMTFRFGIDLLQNGETLKFWLTVVSETVVLILLSIVLKKREKYREAREKDLGK